MSNEAAVHDDLQPEQTEGFKVGEKKTIDEYQKLGKSRKETIYRNARHVLSLYDKIIMAVSIQNSIAIRHTKPSLATPHSHLHPHRPKR